MTAELIWGRARARARGKGGEENAGRFSAKKNQAKII